MPAGLTGRYFDSALYGDPVLLGTIDATTTAKTNAEATVPFGTSGDLLKGKLLLLQCSVEFHVAQVDLSTGDATTSSVKIAADQLFYMQMRSGKGYVSIVLPTGTGNVRVYEMNG